MAAGSALNADGITPKQEAAIIALMNEATVARAAITADVDERTLHRWLNEPDFSRAYRNARRLAFAQAVAVTQRYAAVAIHTLAKIMTDTTIGASARVSAAVALLRVNREGIELDDLAARVEELEQSLAGGEGRSRGNAYSRAEARGAFGGGAGFEGSRGGVDGDGSFGGEAPP